VPPCAKNPPVHEALELVGHRLRLHGHGLRQVTHTQFPGSHQGMQETQPGIIGKNLKDVCQRSGLDGSKQGAVVQRWFAWTAGEMFWVVIRRPSVCS
jgi:hypothetical protein